MRYLQQADSEIHAAIMAETDRQRSGLNLIASENIVSEAVLEALGTPLTNKYSEGYPGERYYSGNEHIDVIETLAIERAKKLYGAEHANVQPHSGSTANFAAYLALTKPGDTIMTMDLAHGGHLTHGASFSFSGKFYNIAHYGVNRDTELIDMEQVRTAALDAKPKVLLAGYSSYPRTLDFAAFRAIADEVGAYFMVDMAHFAGLVAAGVYPDPVPHADVITTTTHKTLRGPRGGLILCQTADRLRPKSKRTLAKRIDSAVFPGAQGGPLDHVIAAKAVSFGEALSPDFTEYQKTIVRNANALAETLSERGLRIVTGGTDNHLVLTDVTPIGLSGKQAEELLEAVGISSNRNLIPFDERKPTDPSGLRLGTAALSTRGLDETEIKEVADLIMDRLTNPESADIKKRITSRVQEIAAAHPIYPNWP